MKAEFICNMPAGSDDFLCDLRPACVPRIFVEAKAEWRRIGENLIGEPYGKTPLAGDVGVYHCPMRGSPFLVNHE